ncbi:hypothetical protein [Shinella sp.]|uniref:hypothetical protein n=1 Tax=Shinella sp. TaxID=1870904 RepID=UPI0039E58BAC
MNVTRQEALDFMNVATRNWADLPPLAEDDIGDVATALLAFLVQRLPKTESQTLDQPAQIGSTVFVAGVSTETVIRSAQRFYEHMHGGGSNTAGEMVTIVDREDHDGNRVKVIVDPHIAALLLSGDDHES